MGAEAIMKTTSANMTGSPIPWTDFTDQSSAGRIEITFTAPTDYQNKSIWLVSRDTVPFNPWREGSLGVWLWNNEIHARIGGPTSAGILRPGTGNTSLTPGQQHTVSFNWDSRAGGGLAVLVDGVLTAYDYRILEGADAIAGQPFYLGSMDPARLSYSGPITVNEYDLPEPYDPCGAPETTTNNVPTPQLASCSAPPPPPPPDPPPISANNYPIADLTWEAPTENTDGTPLTNLKGYIIYWGDIDEASNKTFSNSLTLDVADAVSYDLELPEVNGGDNVFFAMKACNTEDECSDYSNIVSKIFPIRIGDGSIIRISIL